MRIVAMMMALAFCSTAAMAQDKPPPAPKATKAAKPKAAPAAKQKPPSLAERLQACLEIDDATKERLNCYDAVIPPAPKPRAGTAKGVMDCRFVKEEDERLTCFNGFVEKIPKLN
jgi:hypothetical protein